MSVFDPKTADPKTAPAWYREFVPRRGLSNGHLHTIAGNFLPRGNQLPLAEPCLVPVDEESSVLCHCYWQPQTVRGARLTVILLHGLEGSSRSQCVIGNANKLWLNGANVICMNMRNCGGDVFGGDDYVDMELYTPTLYHSGMSGDVLAVAQHFILRHGLQSIALAGYSMGGNMVLKLAGELGAGMLGDALPQLCAVVGVSPLVDIAESSDSLHEPQNRFYEWRFMRGLLKRYRRKVELYPHRYDIERAKKLHSVREFDDRITAFYEGFASADDYYYRAAAARVIDTVAVPTLLLHSTDDPFIRYTAKTRAAIEANKNITLLETEHGGHCAFLSPPQPEEDDDGYWAEMTMLRYFQSAAGLHSGVN
jgi:uncharacterized protein